MPEEEASSPLLTTREEVGELGEGRGGEGTGEDRGSSLVVWVLATALCWGRRRKRGRSEEEWEERDE